MSRPIVIFGNGDIAEIAKYYFETDAGRTVAGFVVDGQYMTGPSFLDLPLVAFEQIGEMFSPDTFDMFIALSYSKMNSVRSEKFAQAKSRGYRLANYISSRATVLSDLRGENLFILEDNVIQPFVNMGSNVTLWSGNHIGHHSTIEDDVFITSHVVVSGGVTVGAKSFLGVNATIRDHVIIGHHSLIGAGSLITESTEPFGVYTAPVATKSNVPSNRIRKI
jgi:sugar O-acyltransferase (sialic acid O-acetyltransferase NeuD family)